MISPSVYSQFPWVDEQCVTIRRTVNHLIASQYNVVVYTAVIETVMVLRSGSASSTIVDISTHRCNSPDGSPDGACGK